MCIRDSPYIFTERNGIYIIDLQKTVRKLEEAYMFVRDLSAKGESVLFVGTKKQAQEMCIRDSLYGLYFLQNYSRGNPQPNGI